MQNSFCRKPLCSSDVSTKSSVNLTLTLTLTLGLGLGLTLTLALSLGLTLTVALALSLNLVSTQVRLLQLIRYQNEKSSCIRKTTLLPTATFGQKCKNIFSLL